MAEKYSKEQRAFWARQGHLRRRYGLTIQDFADLLDKQNGSCAICRKPIEGIHNCSIDHSHKTGLVRGVLCHNCNVLLGHARDDRSILAAASEYLLAFE